MLRSSLRKTLSSIFTDERFYFYFITFLCCVYYISTQEVVLDDAFIYFRVVENFLVTGKPVFNLGDEYFIATSPLWVFILAVSKFCFPFVALEFLAKFIWIILLIISSYLAYLTFRSFVGRWALFVSTPFFLSPIIATMTGNEIALVYLAIFGVLWACISGKLLWVGIFAGVGYLARGEVALILIPAVLFFRSGDIPLLFLSRQSVVNLFRLAASFATIILPWHVYYFLTFNHFFPETFSIKMMQGQSGLWIIFHQAILNYIYILLNGNMYLLLLAVVGAWHQKRLFWFMALYVFIHTVLYSLFNIPYYHWYYYDYYIFTLLLILFGVFALIDVVENYLINKLSLHKLWMSNIVSVLLLIFFVVIFPMGQTNEGFIELVYKRYNSYQLVGRFLLGEVDQSDIVLSGEVGIISYILKDYEIRDINGIASPNVTLSNINEWNYFIEFYQPRYILFRGDEYNEFMCFMYEGDFYVYEKVLMIDNSAEFLETSVYRFLYSDTQADHKDC